MRFSLNNVAKRSKQMISADKAPLVLLISFNTAKSHIRNVYVKIGVHTRQELLDLIEQGK